MHYGLRAMGAVIKDLGTFVLFFQGKFPMGGKAAKDLEEIQVRMITI